MLIDGRPNFEVIGYDCNNPETPCTNTLAWQNFTDFFLASGSSTLIELMGEAPPNDNTNGLGNLTPLDNVVVRRIVISMGEPATLGLLGCGTRGCWPVPSPKHHNEKLTPERIASRRPPLVYTKPA